MNLLFLLGKFPSIGGVETVTAILANEFSARGHEVHVVSFEQVTETPSPALDSRVTLHRLGYPVSSQANLAALTSSSTSGACPSTSPGCAGRPCGASPAACWPCTTTPRTATRGWKASECAWPGRGIR